MSELNAQTIEHIFGRSVCFYRALLKQYLPSDKNVRILDLPCGEGRMVYALKTMGYNNVLGYDIDKKRLETGQKLNLPLKESYVFDVLQRSENDSIVCIFSTDFLEHMEKNDVIRFLELAHHKIAHGGKMIIRTPCADSPFGSQHIYNDFTHKWAATSGVLRQLLLAAGFSSISVFGESPNLAMRFGLLRVFLFGISRFIANLFLKAIGQGALKIWSSSMWAVACKGQSQTTNNNIVKTI